MTAPTTLHEYQEFVRKEALKIQAYQGWPDDKLNTTLRALGLPEKQRHVFTVAVTAERLVTVVDNEGVTLEEAEAKLAERVAAHVALRGWKVTASEEVPAGVGERSYVTGESDDTLSGQGVGSEHWCNNRSGDTGYRCTREPDHAGNHAGGDGIGRSIGCVWEV